MQKITHIQPTRIVSPHASSTVSRKMGMLDRMMVQHAYPPKAILDGIGLMWGLHFVWERLWLQAVIASFGFALIGTYLGRNVSSESLAQTLLGKLCLGFARPANLLTQLLGYSVLVFGLGLRSSFYCLIGISLILLAHAATWRHVFKHFRIENTDQEKI